MNKRSFEPLSETYSGEKYGRNSSGNQVVTTQITGQKCPGCGKESFQFNEVFCIKCGTHQ